MVPDSDDGVRTLARGQAVTDAAVHFRDRVALVSPQGSETFGELVRHANRVGHALRRLGLAPGDRVGVFAHNRAEVVHTWLACERFGFARLALHSHVPPGTHAETLARAGARALVLDTRFAAALAPHLDELLGVTLLAVGDDVPGWATPLPDVLAGVPDTDPLVDVPESGARSPRASAARWCPTSHLRRRRHRIVRAGGPLHGAQVQADERVHEIVVVDDLPTVLSGAKVQRAALRDRLVPARAVSA